MSITIIRLQRSFTHSDFSATINVYIDDKAVRVL